MFKQLGFIEKVSFENYVVIKYNKKVIGIDGGHYGNEYVEFFRDKRENYYKATGDYYGNIQSLQVNVNLHKAIHQQIKELGWLE